MSEVVLSQWERSIYIEELDVLKEMNRFKRLVYLILFLPNPSYYFYMGGLRKINVVKLLNTKTNKTRIIKERLKK